MKILITILATFVSLNCIGQEIKLSNSSTTKTINKTDLLEIFVGNIDLKNNQCCNYLEVHGTLESINLDSIFILTKTIFIRNQFDSKASTFDFNMHLESNLTPIAKSDILMLTPYKSEKTKKRLKTRSTIGALLFITGSATMLNSLLVSDRKNKKRLLRFGGAQLAVGITLGFTSSPKKYRFNNNDDPWVFK